MTRRELLPLIAAASLRSQAQQAPYPGVSYRNYARCLPDYLSKLAADAYQRRSRELAGLATPAAIRQRQQWAGQTFWNLVGGMPERTPLKIRTTGSLDRRNYKVEKLIYESRPSLFVTANLYLPKSGSGPFPAVLFQMGHSPNGKAAATYQRCCQGLVQLGYVVLGFDPMGQGERINYPDASGIHTRVGSPDDEHSTAGRQLLLTGDSAARFQVWDAVRSLDVLAAHPLVDPKRLATTGQSGGGTLSMFLLAVDQRLASAVVCSGNTENFACRDFNPPGSTDDAEQNFPGSGPAGFDRWDLFYPFAPKPLLISVSDKDFFGTYSPNYISNGWEEFQRLKRVYTVLGHADRLAWGETPLPHGLSYDTRLLVYNWFARWLQNERAQITEEPPTALEPDEALWATARGNVVLSSNSDTPHSICLAGLPNLTSDGDWAASLGVTAATATIQATLLKRVPSSGLDIEAIEIPSARGVWIPAWVFIPKRATPRKQALLLLEPAGRLGRWHEGDLYQELALRGHVVCVPDLRGVGDLIPELSRGAARYARQHDNEEDYAWASLILGKPLLGQRITDVLAVLQGMRNHAAFGGRKICMSAQGRMTVPAQFAAALDHKLSAIYLSGGLASFRSIVEAEIYNHPFANFVPGILRHTDLPEVVRSIAPIRVILAGAVNGSGTTMKTSEVEDLFRGANHVTVRARAEWDVETLSAIN